MRKIVDYTVVEGCSLKGLQDLVRIGLKEGWQPLGRAFKSDEIGDNKTFYAQTLVKYGEDE